MQNFIIQGDLGKGSHASVKLAIQKNTGIYFALKIYYKFNLLDQNKLKNVKREISILKRIQHQNVIGIKYAFEDKQQVKQKNNIYIQILIKKYLNEQIKKDLIPEFEAKYIFKQIVSAIAYCHSKNIVHRDIKLENILYENQNVKIIDFGFAVCTNLKIKIFCGTPTYMSPEIVSKIEYCGKKSDIWSLGIVLYIILVGRCPFYAHSDIELFKKIKNNKLEFPDNLNPQAFNLLNKILRKNPEERPFCEEVKINQIILQNSFFFFRFQMINGFIEYLFFQDIIFMYISYIFQYFYLFFWKYNLQKYCLQELIFKKKKNLKYYFFQTQTK
ncbi:protein kinase domain protein [Ichthyophthirius multifiliis]|uniref:Protein kinase domain protein n=1 Tax=Ichthyophthirius multifiliis TaxID=5932 RepID=G0QNL4_ICHMU|nr:protein kinase domain protein [Ichthyophthirius multifiliis]EGR33203.1 protein kinase domain protein [Ichthyophthirius multifiliis]|eukprot:XP_004037189.1 protein kinase domain protein [Ichthyophthirius multifiliis]